MPIFVCTLFFAFFVFCSSLHCTALHYFDCTLTPSNRYIHNTYSVHTSSPATSQLQASTLEPAEWLYAFLCLSLSLFLAFHFFIISNEIAHFFTLQLLYATCQIRITGWLLLTKSVCNSKNTFSLGPIIVFDGPGGRHT